MPPRKSKKSKNDTGILNPEASATIVRSNATFVSKKFSGLNGKRCYAVRTTLETGEIIIVVDLLDGSYEFHCKPGDVKFDE